MHDEILDGELTEKSVRNKIEILNHIVLIILWLAIILNLQDIFNID